MKFYTFPLSPNCRRVAAVIDHLGLEVETVFVDLSKGESHRPEYAAIAPTEKVPALSDGDFHLFESYAIMQYLCGKKPGNTLLPQDERTRADINRWMFWAASALYRPTGTLTYESLVKPMLLQQQPDPRAIQEGLELFALHMKVLESHLGKHPYLVGDGLTLADYTIASMFTFSGPAQMPMHQYPNVQAWLARMDQDRSWQATAPQPMAGAH